MAYLRLITLAPLLILTAAAEDWTRFRGPNGVGVADSTNLPTEFGKTKNLAWRTEVPFARSSPILTKDRIFLTANEGDKLITLALDRKTGRIEWRREIVRDHAHKIYKGNDTATPTPASDGTNVYAFFPDLGLVSYGPDGNERWRMKLGPFESFYGLSSSPVLSGDTLYLLCDQTSGSFLAAIDSKSGRLRWRKERPHVKVEGYATPILYTPAGGKPQVIASGSYRLDAYDATSGELLWWAGKQGTYPISTPAIADGVIYALGNGADEPEMPAYDKSMVPLDKDKDGKISQAEFSAMAEFAPHFGFFDTNKDGFISREEWEAKRQETVSEHGLVAIRAGGSGDQTAKNILWRYKKAENMASPLVYKGVIYVVKSGGIMTSLNPANGEVHKAARLKDGLGPYYASPVAGDGKIYFISEAGKVTVVKAGEQWESLASNDLGEECYSTPAIADGRLYIRTRNALYCFAQAK